MPLAGGRRRGRFGIGETRMDAKGSGARPTIEQIDVVRVGLIDALRQVLQQLAAEIGPDREDELTELRNRIIGEALRAPMLDVPPSERKLVTEMIAAGIGLAFHAARSRPGPR